MLSEEERRWRKHASRPGACSNGSEMFARSPDSESATHPSPARCLQFCGKKTNQQEAPPPRLPPALPMDGDLQGALTVPPSLDHSASASALQSASV